MLVLLGLAEALGMSLWFAGNAVAPELQERWQLTAGQVGWLTTSVQLGFVAGTAAIAVLNLADILAARLAPGAGLPLKVLQHRYAVGLTPLREALTVLSGNGLVIAEENGRGFRVAPASRADFEDVAQCRRRLEAMAMRLSIAARK